AIVSEPTVKKIVIETSEAKASADKPKVKELCNAIEKIMHEMFQISYMRELTFFLGLHVKQKQDGIFISQDTYVAKILKKYGFLEVKNVSTPIETQKPLLKDEYGEEVDVHIYQFNPKVSYLYAVKRIFRYLKGHPKLGLWNPKDYPFDLVAYIDHDYVGASLDRKSTTGGSANPTDPHHTPIIIQQSTSQPQKKQKSRKPRIKDTKVPQLSVPTSVRDEAVNEEMDDSLERATTIATSIDAGQDRGGGPRCQKAMRDAAAQTRSKRNMVLDLETIKTTQAMEIKSLKRRVKKLEKKQRSRTHKLKRLYKVGLSTRVESSEDEGLDEKDASKQKRISNIDTDNDITLVSTPDEQMFDADQDLHGEEVFVAQQDDNAVEKEVDVAQV
nr:hypothetical protein [Tanacetum cinerariifolium]